MQAQRNMTHRCINPLASETRIACLEKLGAQQRIEWSLENLPGCHVLSSSFGAQSAVMLHMLTRQYPDIPVLLIDTGYLFPETYQFIDQLNERLKLNLKVYSADQSPAWQEARHGKLWEKGLQGIETYNRINKVEPMIRALMDLQSGTWYSGLRRSQSNTREQLPVADKRKGRWKILPIADWSDRDVYTYLKAHKLPYHPLWHQGYVSIGDTHTTRPLSEAGNEQAARFFGLKRECGIHEEL